MNGSMTTNDGVDEAATDSSRALSASNLRFTAHGGKPTVRNVTLDIQKAARFGFLGPNGAKHRAGQGARGPTAYKTTLKVWGQQ